MTIRGHEEELLPPLGKLMIILCGCSFCTLNCELGSPSILLLTSSFRSGMKYLSSITTEYASFKQIYCYFKATSALYGLDEKEVHDLK